MPVYAEYPVARDATETCAHTQFGLVCICTSMQKLASFSNVKKWQFYKLLITKLNT